MVWGDKRWYIVRPVSFWNGSCSLREMRASFKFFLVVAVLAACAGGHAQQAPPDSDLASITARGRFLAEYERSAWYATDVVLKFRPNQDVMMKFIARKTDTGWLVAFGNLDEANGAFVISFEGVQDPASGKFSAKAFEPPLRDTGFFLAAARGIELARQNAALQKGRPYSTFVLPLDSGEFYVYVLPTQTVFDLYPLGGDERLLISADGLKVLAREPLHRTIHDINLEAVSTSDAIAGIHSHAAADEPEDTDVFFVVRQKNPAPEFVGTKSGTYEIKPDGSIVRMK